MRKVSAMILLIPAIGCTDMPNDSVPINMETPEGDMIVQKSTVAPVPQKITNVTGDELKRLLSLGTQGPDFVAAYSSNEPEPDLKDYDRVFRAWQITESTQHSNEQVVEILGGYLGNKCVADFHMEWVTVSDEYGTDYAVRSKTSEVMAFPFSTVMKRIEAKEYDFLYGVYHALKQMLASGDYKSRDQDSPNK